MFNKVREMYYNKKAEEHCKEYKRYFSYVDSYVKKEDKIEMLDLARAEISKWAYYRRIAIAKYSDKSIRDELLEKFYVVLNSFQETNLEKEKAIRG